MVSDFQQCPKSLLFSTQMRTMPKLLCTCSSCSSCSSCRSCWRSRPSNGGPPALVLPPMQIPRQSVHVQRERSISNHDVLSQLQLRSVPGSLTHLPFFSFPILLFLQPVGAPIFRCWRCCSTVTAAPATPSLCWTSDESHSSSSAIVPKGASSR